MKKTLTLLLCIMPVLFIQPASPQNIHWNKTPLKGYVYQITNREAQKLLTLSRSKTITEKLLYNLKDTFDVEKGWINRPEKGHFILVNITGNKVHLNYTCVFPYQVFLLKEYNALAIQVLDQEGNIRTDAKVKIGRLNRIMPDTATNTYRIENDAFRGEYRIATVELEGFRSVFNIRKHDVPEWYNNDYGHDNGPDFYSYMITDKNKYKPGEKVRFKSYALSGFRFPIKKELEIWLRAYPKQIKLGTVKPHRPGSFAGEFVLHDSLKLTLDKAYTLQLCDENKRVVSSCNFRFEDYELSGNRLDIKLRETLHYYPDTNSITITATNENGLMLKDASAEIVVKTNAILESFQQFSILPDTLIYNKINLDPEKPSVIIIPPDLFKKTNTSYSVFVTVKNSENQLMTSNTGAVYYYSAYELKANLVKDSIYFNLLKNNKPLENIPSSIRIDDEKTGHAISLPYREKINPAIREYHLENDFLHKDIAPGQLNPQLDITGGIVQDSFNVTLVNPCKLQVTWLIYQGGQLLHRGSGIELTFKSKITDRTQNYYAEILYTFGGQEQIKQRVYEFRESFLDIALNIPDRVYPGQKVDATITVKDQKGIPAKGVDLTAMAFTARLNYYVPPLPYYGTYSSPRLMGLNYSKTNVDHFQTELRLDYSKWNKLSMLDTMMYYRFCYPDSSGFLYTSKIDDSTQFAPYVMKDGEAQMIYVIETDHVPVYFSWARPSEYSFYISPGRKHSISLRLWDKVIILDSLSFEKGCKTIISFNLDSLPKKTTIDVLEDKFSPTELLRISPMVSSFSRPSYALFSYLGNDLTNDFIPLFSSVESRGYGDKIIGPLSEGKKTYTESGGLHITYRHAGNYNYAFEDNIVYKTNTYNLWPFQLSNTSYDPVSNINDLRMNKNKFLQQQYPKMQKEQWHTRTIDMIDSDGRIRIFLPDVKEAGIAAVIFRNTATGNTMSPFFDIKTMYRVVDNTLPTGNQSIIVLYTDGKYLKADSIILNPHHHLILNLNNSEWQPADSLSLTWLDKYEWDRGKYYRSIKTPEIKPDRVYQFTTKATGNLTGTVFDENNDPLPGAIVLVKGTENGAVTDINGHFVLQIDDYSVNLSISFIGYASEELQVTRGSEIRISLLPDILALDEIVVIGYGMVKKSDVTAALQGKVAGISIINAADPAPTEIPEEKPVETNSSQSERQLYEELLMINTIRSNFSDVGFWEPKLYTDNHGTCKFSITFPDDITRWDAVVYAMNRSLQTGTLYKNIRSYKPLSAELKIPGFLTQGDSAYFIGKISNYTTDSIIEGQIQWSGFPDSIRNIRFNHFHSDLLPIRATDTDSLAMRYSFTRDDGYMDGEERKIPVVEQGIIRAEGNLKIFINGDEFSAKASSSEKQIIQIMDNQLDIYKAAATDLIHYRYLCNEQLASRLAGFINYKRIMQFEGKPFKYDRDIQTIISRLIRNQNKEFLWSWWEISNNTSYWMSAHILRALKLAKEAGYEVNLDIENLARRAEYKYDFLQSFSISDIYLLQSLAEWEVQLKYGKYLPVLDSLLMHQEKLSAKSYNPYMSFLTEKLILQEIRQMKGLNYQRDSLLQYRKEGILGDIHFSDGKLERFWYTNELSANVVAYRIIQRDSLLHDYLVPLQLYFMGTHGNNGWNTYQSSNLIMCVLPDLLAEGTTKERPATVKVTGKENATITRYPYTIELLPGEEINVKKETGMPLFYMQYVQERVTKAKAGVEGLRIKTWFTDNRTRLEAGKPVDLIADVVVEKNSAVENVMIEFPIPASCSYNGKRFFESDVETHREYYKEKTVIFCEKMEPGRYTFTISLVPRFTGLYFVNPAQVSLMYFPVVNANTDMKTVVVK